MIEICPKCGQDLDSTLYLACPYCGAIAEKEKTNMEANDAVKITIHVEIDWRKMGELFALSGSIEQAEFLIAMIHEIRSWGGSAPHDQMWAIARSLSSEAKSDLADLLPTLWEKPES